MMRITQDTDATFSVAGLTADQAATLGALADFPYWGDQPKEVAGFCAALHNALAEVLPETAALTADAHGMAPVTTVELN